VQRRIELVDEMARFNHQMEKAEEAIELAQAAYEAARRGFEQKRNELFALIKREGAGRLTRIRARRVKLARKPRARRRPPRQKS
jgi:hypothetical protein